MIDHKSRHKNSHVLKQCIEREHELASLEDFIILETNHKKNKLGRKISEALYITVYHCISSLNTQEKSAPLKLFH